MSEEKFYNCLTPDVQDDFWSHLPDNLKEIVIGYYRQMENVKYYSELEDGILIACENLFGKHNIKNFQK